MQTMTVLAGFLLLVAASAAADGPDLTKKTHTYKTVGPTKIQADVHRADDKEVRPVVVWLHGGALIMGNRASVPKQLLDLCRKEGYALVSFDYRLAPEVKLPAIIEDVEDAFRWLREEGAKLHLDPDRVVVTGGSAGGYLTLMTGVRVKPRPRALVAYWGYGDVDGDWYVKPSAHYRKQPLVGKDEAFKGVGGAVTTGSESGYDQKARSRFYLYLRQNGLWTREVTGFDPERDRKKLDPYCPVRNVSSEYPPTLMVHGTEDTDVPYELSAAMEKELARNKVPHELVTVRGAGHGLSGGDRKQIDEAHEKALTFIREHLKRKPGSESNTGFMPSALQPRSRGLPRSGVGPPLRAGDWGALTATHSVSHIRQPRSRGFSGFGFSHTPWSRCARGFQRLDPFQPVVNLSLGVVLTLVADVPPHPLQVFRAETDDAVAVLPFEDLATRPELLVRLVGGRALQLTDQLTDEDSGDERDRHMHLGFRTAKFVDDHSRRVDQPAANVTVDERLHLGSQLRPAVFRVPDHVQIDFGVESARHDGFSPWLKAEAEHRKAP